MWINKNNFFIFNEIMIIIIDILIIDIIIDTLIIDILIIDIIIDILTEWLMNEKKCTISYNFYIQVNVSN